MPLNIVCKVADVDSSILLRGFAYRLHHLFFGCSSIFERSWRTTTSAATVGRPRIAPRLVLCTTHRTSRSAISIAVSSVAVSITSAIFVTSTSRALTRIRTSISSRASRSRTSSRRSRSFPLWHLLEKYDPQGTNEEGTSVC